MGAQSEYEFDAFISHNTKQKPWVRLFVRQLRALGVRIFFDEDDIQLGGSIVHSIERAIESSRHVLLVLSTASLDSRWVAAEVAAGLFEDPDAADGRVIPLL